MSLFPSQSFVDILKGIYTYHRPAYYDVEGAKEELISRIEKLSLAEKAILGIVEDEVGDKACQTHSPKP